MNLVGTIKSMIDDGYIISFSKADLPMDGIYITIKKTEPTPDKLYQKMNWTHCVYQPTKYSQLLLNI